MRLLRIDQVGDMRAPILLHEQLSVVVGLRGATRARLLAGLAGIPRGRPDGLSGEIEAQGVRFDLTPEALGMLELPSSTAIVIHAGDLPGGGEDDDRANLRRVQLELDREQLVDQLEAARQSAAAADAERATLTSRLTEARAAAAEAVERGAGDHEQAAAQQRVEAAAQAVAEASDAVEAANAHHRSLLELGGDAASADQLEARQAELRRLGAEASAAVDAAQARLDPGAADALAAAEAAHAEAEAALVAFDDEADVDADDRPQVGDPADDTADDESAEPGPDAALAERRADLLHDLSRLDVADPAPLETALSRVVLPDAPVEDDGSADRLAREWADLHDQLDALDGVGLGRATRPGPGRRPTAKPAVAVSNGPISQDDVDAIEAAHTAVLEAQERSEARFGGSKKAKRRLTEARDAEQEVLDAFGFETYAEFMMSSSRSDDAEVLDVEPYVELDPRAELHSRLDQLRDDIGALLGHEPADDPTAELRAYPVAIDSSGALTGLHQELVRVGMALDDAEFQPDTLVALARVWLSEHQQIADHRASVLAELAEVEAELGVPHPSDAHRVEDGSVAEQGQAEHEASARRAELAARLDAAAAAVQAATDRLEAAQAAAAELDGHENAFFEAQAAEDAVTAELALHHEDAAAAAAKREADLAAAADAVTQADAAHQAAVDEHREAHAALAAWPAGEPVVADPVPDVPGLEAELGSLTEQVASASATVRMLEVEVEAIDRRLAESAAVEQQQTDDRTPVEVTDELLEEIEWELLRRLSDHRQVSIAGSLPLVLDDPFRHLSGDDAVRLLNGLERMSNAVQLVVLTDDPTVVGWADELGDARASVVHAG